VRYNADYKIGEVVRIGERPQLDGFLSTWKFHNKLTPEHLEHAGEFAAVSNVYYYHGGNPLYVLVTMPDLLWHEQLISRPSGNSVQHDSS
jgi:hypothetical protein